MRKKQIGIWIWSIGLVLVVIEHLMSYKSFGLTDGAAIGVADITASLFYLGVVALMGTVFVVADSTDAQVQYITEYYEEE